MRQMFARFVADESGATAIEYGLIGALISITIIVSSQNIGNAINDLFASSGSKVKSVSDTLN